MIHLSIAVNPTFYLFIKVLPNFQNKNDICHTDT